MRTIFLLILIFSQIGLSLCFIRPQYLKCGEPLKKDEYLESTNGYYLLLQNNCNLAIYRSKHFVDRNILWQSATITPGCADPYLINQNDGNQVVYDGNKVIWSSHTEVGFAVCYNLAMQDDGNLVLYTQANAPLWSTQTAA